MLSRSIRTAAFLLVATIMVAGVSSAAEADGLPGRVGPETAVRASGGVILYAQPPSSAGGLYQSSRNGSDYDQYVWDAFILPPGQTIPITEVRWRGGYDPARFGSGGPVLDFTVSIYASIPGGTQPNVPNPPLVQYLAGGNAGELAVAPGVYDYHFTLPSPFRAAGGTKYWLQIEASQNGIPDWGISAGTGGEGTHFRQLAAYGDVYYQTGSGDAAFSLLGPGLSLYLPLVWRQ